MNETISERIQDVLVNIKEETRWIKVVFVATMVVAILIKILLWGSLVGSVLAVTIFLPSSVILDILDYREKYGKTEIRWRNFFFENKLVCEIFAGKCFAVNVFLILYVIFSNIMYGESFSIVLKIGCWITSIAIAILISLQMHLVFQKEIKSC